MKCSKKIIINESQKYIDELKEEVKNCKSINDFYFSNKIEEIIFRMVNRINYNTKYKFDLSYDYSNCGYDLYNKNNDCRALIKIENNKIEVKEDVLQLLLK